MRYAKDQKQRTRAKVVAAASRAFRRDGIDRTGIVGLMGEVGLTQGGFYLHFASKDQLIEEAVLAALTGTRDLLRAAAHDARTRSEDPLEAVVREYLKSSYVKKPENGCALAMLGDELTRRNPSMRRILSTAAQEIVAVIADVLPRATGPHSQPTAVAILAVMMGTLQLARLTPGRTASSSIVEAGVRSAVHLGAGQA